MLITAAEVAEILGMTLQSVYDAAARGRIPRHAPTHVRRQYDRDEVEAISLSRIKHGRYGTHHYWATTGEAAVELGVTTGAARHMMLSDRLPYVTAPSGRRYVRRHQLEVIANAQEVRRIEEMLQSDPHAGSHSVD